jgi:hypothetical protein
MIRTRNLSLLLALAASAASVLRAAPAATEVPSVPTEITCNYAEAVSGEKEMTTVFTGDVVVTATNMSLRCDKLEVISFIKGPKDQLVAKENQFKSMLATGNVVITQGLRKATCGRAEVLPGENRIILSMDPVVTDTETGWTYKGVNLYLLRGERRVHGEKVTFTGPSVKDLGFDKKKAGNGTPATGNGNGAAPKTDADAPKITVPGATQQGGGK